jgi:hypothetical protein
MPARYYISVMTPDLTEEDKAELAAEIGSGDMVMVW